MQGCATINIPNQASLQLSIKISVTSGPARRFQVGDPQIQVMDVLAGETVSRAAAAEHLAKSGEILLDEPSVQALGKELVISEWRESEETQERFAVIESLALVVEPTPWPASLSSSASLTEESLRPWVLPAVYSRETSGQGTFLTEFRPAVALFVRFGGLDYDREEVGAQLDRFVQRVQGVLARYEGTLLQVIVGDKGSYFYGVFGAPMAHEDDARRGVKAAWELLEEEAREGRIAGLQVGLSQGTMRVGTYGGPTRRTYGVFGDEVNLAARLMQSAASGEILLSERVQQAAAGAFTFEPRPALSLKGKAQPLTAFAVKGERRQRAIRLQEPSYALPMVGRQNELQTIVEKLDLARQGQAQVIGIVAEAGLGKSRLVAEVIRAARGKGFTGYGGACQSDGVNTSYLVWKPIWSAFFELDPTRALTEQMQQVEDVIRDRAPHRVQALPLLGSLLNLAIPENDFTQTLEPKDRKGALHALLEDCLKAAVSEAPILLVLEDLHWIDPLSLDLLEQLMRALAALPIGVVLAYRPLQGERVQTSRLENLPGFTEIELAELSPSESEQAMRAKLAQLYPTHNGALPTQLVEKLRVRAQGNPFYLEELLNFLHDRGLNPLDPTAVENLELPDSLHALILSRIDQLTEREKTTLRLASIIGRLFRAAWLAGYYPAIGELPRVKSDLDKLNKLDITPLDTPEPELTYLFKHIVTHEVTYESLSYATRAQLHEQLARYLEGSIEAQHGISLVDTLAYHYGQSENREKQREYSNKAGDAAKAAYANQAALDYYARLLPLLAEPSEQVELHLKRGGVLELIGQWEEAAGQYQAGLDLTQAPALVARCQFALGKLRQLRGEYAAALEWLEQARRGWTELGDSPGLSHVFTQMGVVYLRQGEYVPAQQHLRESLALARSVGDKPGTATSLNHLGNVAYARGDFPEARALHQESLALRRAIGDKHGIAQSLNNLGLSVKDQGDYPAEQALYEESLALRRAIGDKWGIAQSLNNLGLVAYAQGDYPAARALYEESLALLREMGDKWGRAYPLFGLGLVALAQSVGLTPAGIGEARQLLAESLRWRKEVGDKRGMASSLVGLAGVAVSSGDSRRAVQLAGAADALLTALEADVEFNVRPVYAQTMAAARTALSEPDFNAAWAQGQALTLDEAVALALERPSTEG